MNSFFGFDVSGMKYLKYLKSPISETFLANFIDYALQSALDSTVVLHSVSSIIDFAVFLQQLSIFDFISPSKQENHGGLLVVLDCVPALHILNFVASFRTSSNYRTYSPTDLESISAWILTASRSASTENPIFLSAKFFSLN